MKAWKAVGGKEEDSPFHEEAFTNSTYHHNLIIYIIEIEKSPNKALSERREAKDANEELQVLALKGIALMIIWW